MTDFELKVMKIITVAGESKSISFEALKLARQGDIEAARAKIEEARKIAQDAHQVQTELIVKETRGEKVEMSMLMVHAQDHLMGCMCSRELIEEMIFTYEAIKNLKNSDSRR